MKIGDLVKIVNCNNGFLNGKIGTVVMNEWRSEIYGLCILIQGTVYGFDEDEVEMISESR
jgi:hypothetical protein